jgi:hypothetical protein
VKNGMSVPPAGPNRKRSAAFPVATSHSSTVPPQGTASTFPSGLKATGPLAIGKARGCFPLVADSSFPAAVDPQTAIRRPSGLKAA